MYLYEVIGEAACEGVSCGIAQNYKFFFFFLVNNDP